MLSQHLEDQLVERFPWAKETTIYVNDGWYRLIFNMFEELDPFHNDIEINEINEKYGAMIVHYRGKEGCSSEVVAIFSKYEALSETTCEVCGGKGGIKEVNGWLTAYCDTCYDSARAEHQKRLEERRAREERKFSGICFSCGSGGAVLRELGNEIRIGYCDSCYENIKFESDDRERQAKEFFNSFKPLNGMQGS